jgi:hypothetical protein
VLVCCLGVACVRSSMQQMRALTQAAAAARRARENKRFFSGVDKAFGKKAAEGMLDAFNGKVINLYIHIYPGQERADQVQAQREAYIMSSLLAHN